MKAESEKEQPKEEVNNAESKSSDMKLKHLGKLEQFECQAITMEESAPP
jgi:hypothetical protein